MVNWFDWRQARTIGILLFCFMAVPAVGYLVGISNSSQQQIILQLTGAIVGGIVLLMQPRLGLWLLIFLIPLQRLAMVSENVTLVRIVGTALFGAWISWKLQSKTRVYLPRSLLAPMTVFIFSSFASILWASNRQNALAMLFTFLQLVAFVIILVDLTNTVLNLKVLLYLFLLSSIISLAIAWFDFQNTSTSRGVGGVGSENVTGILGVMIIPLLYYGFQSSGRLLRYLSLVGMFIALVGVSVTVSRTALLLLPAMFLLQQLQQWRQRRGLRGIVILSAVALVTLFAFPWDSIDQRFLQLQSGDEISAESGRGWRAQKAVQLIIDNPLFGSGLGSLELENGRYFVVHNLFLQIAAELGILGICAILWLWFDAWRVTGHARREATRNKDKDAVALISAIRLTMLAYFAYSFTASNQDARLLWLMFALAQSTYRLYANPSENPAHYPLQQGQS